MAPWSKQQLSVIAVGQAVMVVDGPMVVGREGLRRKERHSATTIRQTKNLKTVKLLVSHKLVIVSKYECYSGRLRCDFVTAVT